MYEQLKSTTCPACFAKLLTVDDATADELSRARAEVEATADFQAARAADNERFQEQTFGGCVGVGLIALLTLIAVLVIVIVGIRRSQAPRVPSPVARTASSLDIPSPLPVGGASLDAVLPAAVGPYHRGESDSRTTLPGTLTPIFHAAYRRDGPDGARLDVYAIPTGRPTAEQNEFRLGIALAVQVQRRQAAIFATEHWRYAAVGPGGMGGPVSGEDFRAVLAQTLARS